MFKSLEQKQLALNVTARCGETTVKDTWDTYIVTNIRDTLYSLPTFSNVQNVDLGYIEYQRRQSAIQSIHTLEDKILANRLILVAYYKQIAQYIYFKVVVNLIHI